MRNLKSINPSDYSINGEVPVTTNDEIDKMLQNVHKAKQMWRKMKVEKRLELLQDVFDNFLEKQDIFVKFVSQEMGMPIKDALFDIEDAMKYFKWNLENAPEYLNKQILKTTETSTFTIHKEPHGIGAIILQFFYYSFRE